MPSDWHNLPEDPGTQPPETRWPVLAAHVLLQVAPKFPERLLFAADRNGVSLWKRTRHGTTA